MLTALLLLLAISWLIVCALLLYCLFADARVIEADGAKRLIPLWVGVLLSPFFSCGIMIFFYLLLPFMLLEMILRRSGIMNKRAS